MQKEILLENKKVAYILRKSKRARYMRLAVYRDGSVVLTTPFSLGESIAENFLLEKTEWLLSKLDYFLNNSVKTVQKYTRKDYLQNKAAAHRLAVERIEYFNKTYQFEFKSISIRNQKTRWGSCSRKGNLNFNYKIVFLPARFADYVIVHELCHLHEFNHSQKFWTLVRKTIPEYKEIKRGFRKDDFIF
jgi:predicted metal-dependent hydrolase